MQRRSALKWMMGVVSAALMLPFQAIAAIWNKAAFEAVGNQQALTGLQVNQTSISDLITITAPNYSENGAVVQIEVHSLIAGTEGIAILVDKNPTALIANYSFNLGAVPKVITRIKMAETSTVQAVVKVGNQYFSAGKMVEVSLGGCG